MAEVYYTDPLAELYCGDAREVLGVLPAESVQACITSPPFWGLRDYKIPPLVWGGQVECGHEWQMGKHRCASGGLTGSTLGGVSQDLSPRDIEVRRFTWQDASCAKCGAWLGSLGLEPSPELYVQHIVDVFRAVRRVLRKDGTVWLNMGDSYAHGEPGGGSVFDDGRNDGRQSYETDKPRGREKQATLAPGLKPLDLCGIPWRVALALQADGWWLRADCIWAKPNPMPESVSGSRWERHRIKVAPVSPDTYTSLKNRQGEGVGTGWSPAHPENGEKPTLAEWADCPGCPVCLPNDGLVLRRGSWRPTTSHEYLFMLAKSSEYYADGEAVREPQVNIAQCRTKPVKASMPEGVKDDMRSGLEFYGRYAEVPGGRNKRTVWTINTQPYAGSHFATFPEKLVEPCLLAGTSERGACPRCGKAWVRVIRQGERQKHGTNSYPTDTEHYHNGAEANGRSYKFSRDGYITGFSFENKTLGWRPACGCGEAEAVPCMVLDPFAGSGTVGVVARQWGRKAILIELSEKYCQLAVKRLTGRTPALRGS